MGIPEIMSVKNLAHVGCSAHFSSFPLHLGVLGLPLGVVTPTQPRPLGLQLSQSWKAAGLQPQPKAIPSPPGSPHMVSPRGCQLAVAARGHRSSTLCPDTRACFSGPGRLALLPAQRSRSLSLPPQARCPEVAELGPQLFGWFPVSLGPTLARGQ